MDDEVASQIAQALKKLNKDLLPLETGVWLDAALEGAPFAVIGYQIAIVGGEVSLMEFDKIWMLQFP